MITRDGHVRYLDKFSEDERKSLKALVWSVYEVLDTPQGVGHKSALVKLQKAYDKITDLKL